MFDAWHNRKSTMTIPHHDTKDHPHHPHPGPRHGAPGAPVCPTCSRAYDLFDHDASRLLDWVARLQSDLSHLKYALEEVLP